MGGSPIFLPIGEFQSGLRDEVVVYEAVKGRLVQGLFVFVDFTLLTLVLVHGLNGIRNIALEWKQAHRFRRQITAAIWIVGITAFVLGVRSLLVFIL